MFSLLFKYKIVMITVKSILLLSSMVISFFLYIEFRFMRFGAIGFQLKEFILISFLILLINIFLYSIIYGIQKTVSLKFCISIYCFLSLIIFSIIICELFSLANEISFVNSAYKNSLTKPFVCPHPFSKNSQYIYSPNTGFQTSD